ncbi:hypothetical protein AABB24_029721 [Solanum stoloniferum]|uniref:Uncharacterized protein n=1 Tax=Solanum stoloniferum TaxID=62892 RepID=A0ABD2RZ40_9SOLN
MHDRVRKFVRRLDSDYIDACSIAALNNNMDISRLQDFAQGIEDRRHLQYMSERGDRERRKRARPVVSQGDFQVGPKPRYSIRPPRPPPQQFQGSRFDRQGQLGTGEGLQASWSQQQRGSGQAKTAPPRCATCSRIHFRRCRQGSPGCYSYGQSTRSVGSSSSTQSTGRGPQTPAYRGRCGGREGIFSSGSGQNRIYSLAGRQDS